MTSAELLVDAFGRIRGVVHSAVDGLSPDELAFQVADEANTVAWLVWHLTRVQDDHLAHVAGTEQVWTADGWVKRFDLPFDAAATGYGHSAADVAAVGASTGDLLTGYYDAVHDRTIAYVERLTDSDLTRIVDERWTPAVTLGVRLVSVVSDDLQHAGQASFVAGIVKRRRGSARVSYSDHDDT